jgi:hypothetical protein
MMIMSKQVCSRLLNLLHITCLSLCFLDGRVDFYSIFEDLVKEIIDQNGLEIVLLMYKNPRLPMVRQKCLDLITNIATVPDVAYKIMIYESWFLDHLLIMIRDGDIVSDKIPALSVLIRLLKVMLTERCVFWHLKINKNIFWPIISSSSWLG